MLKVRIRTGLVLWCILCSCIMVSTVGCGVDQQWVKNYVGQELEPLKEDRYKPLEDNLAETRVAVESLQKEIEELKTVEKVEEKGVGFEALESIEQTLEENAEVLQWVQEDLDEMYTRLTALESTVQIPPEGEDVSVPPLKPAPEKVHPPAVEVPVTQPLGGEDFITLSEELKKLRSRVNEVSRHIEHVDQQYQEYHKDVGGLRVDIMNDINALDGKIAVLDEKMSGLKDTQKVILAELAELSQRDVESLEQKLRGLIGDLPK